MGRPSTYPRVTDDSMQAESSRVHDARLSQLYRGSASRVDKEHLASQHGEADGALSHTEFGTVQEARGSCPPPIPSKAVHGLREVLEKWASRRHSSEFRACSSTLRA